MGFRSATKNELSDEWIISTHKNYGTGRGTITMSLPNDLRSVLEQMLSDSEIDGFESGESALFISDPKYAFFRVDNGEYQRADVVRDLNPDGNAQMRIYHEVHRTTTEEVKERLEKVSDIDVVPVDVGFGGDNLDDI